VWTPSRFVSMLFFGARVRLHTYIRPLRAASVYRCRAMMGYSRVGYLEQRRDMMQQWADHLDALCAGRKVVPIRKARAA
jgi:hypothetical protein